jgi:hypothetical protein
MLPPLNSNNEVGITVSRRDPPLRNLSFARLCSFVSPERNMQPPAMVLTFAALAYFHCLLR